MLTFNQINHQPLPYQTNTLTFLENDTCRKTCQFPKCAAFRYVHQ